MSAAVMAVVLWCVPIDSPFTVLIHEKYGPMIELTDCTCVIEKDQAYYVLRRGKLRGHYPTANYSVERKD